MREHTTGLPGRFTRFRAAADTRALNIMRPAVYRPRPVQINPPGSTYIVTVHLSVHRGRNRNRQGSAVLPAATAG